MPSNIEVDLIVKAISEGFEKISADLVKTGQAGEKAGEGAEQASFSFTELNQTLEVGQKAAQIFFGTFQKAFEIGKAGAEATQTAASFDLLLEKVGAAPDLLEQLRQASNNTVDNLKLMSATSTLLAGTQGELATALANSTPQLMEIAKAAQKLNPALGDTTFLYESLATGIKRASPLILDNLGLTIKIEEANRKYAESLGKSVDALSAEEQKMALLTATLDAGKVMIDQVGGSTESASDSIARMEAALKNAADAAQSRFAPAIANAADAIYYMLEGENLVSAALQQHTANMAKSTGTWEQYRNEINRSYEAAGYMVDATGDVIRVFTVEGDVVTEVTDQFNLLTEAQYRNRSETSEAARAADKLTQTNKDTTKATEDLYKTASGWAKLAGGDLPDALYENRDAAEAVIEANRELAEAQEELAIIAAALAAGLSGELQGAMDDYSQTMSELLEEQTTLNEQLAEAEQRWGANSEQVAELRDALADNAEAQAQAAEALARTTAEMIYQQAAAGLDTEAALGLARSMGLLSEQDYAVAASLEALRQQYDSNRDGAISAAEGADEYARRVKLMYEAVALLQQRNVPITFENLKKAMEELATAAGSENAQNAGEVAKDVGEGLADINQEADEAAGTTGDAATGIGDMADAMEIAAGKAGDLYRELSKLPSRIQVNFSQSGGDAVLQLIRDIRDGIADLPDRKTVTITVEAREQEPNITDNESAAGGANRSAANQPQTQINVYNNIYDQMAGEIVLEQQAAAVRGSAEEFMNYGG